MSAWFAYVYSGGINQWVPVPVAARSKAWVCDLPAAENVGSNPAGGMDVCLL